MINKSHLYIKLKPRSEIIWCRHFKPEVDKFKSSRYCCFIQRYIGGVFGDRCINSKPNVTVKVEPVSKLICLYFIINACTTINLNKSTICTKFSHYKYFELFGQSTLFQLLLSHFWINARRVELKLPLVLVSYQAC